MAVTGKTIIAQIPDIYNYSSVAQAIAAVSCGAWQEFPPVFCHEDGPRPSRTSQCGWQVNILASIQSFLTFVTCTYFQTQCWRSFLPRICNL